MSIKRTNPMEEIERDAHRIVMADSIFTEALKALEESRWNECKAFCEQVMDISWSIEQRLATQLIQGLAEAKDEDVVKEYLNEAYSYSR